MSPRKAKPRLPPVNPAALDVLFIPDAPALPIPKPPKPPSKAQAKKAKPKPAPKPVQCSKCDKPAVVRGMCRPHYEQQRTSKRVRPERVLRTRARNRATAELVRKHKVEFEKLLAKAEKDVVAENDQLTAAAKAAGVATDEFGFVRLRPGPPIAGDTKETRIAPPPPPRTSR